MLIINFIAGMSCVGKSYYIENCKAANDEIIDLFKYQQENRDYLNAEYLFYSQIERTLRRAKDSNSTIWIEVPFYKRYRRKAVVSFFKTIAEGFGSNVEWNLTYIQASQDRYLKNIKLRFPDCSHEDGLKYYKTRLENVEVPTLEETIDGWNKVEIVSL